MEDDFTKLGADPKYVPPAKEGYEWVGNSAKMTAKEAIQDYEYDNELLMAEPFFPDREDFPDHIRWAIYRKL